jgi:hypothetical protein
MNGKTRKTGIELPDAASRPGAAPMKHYMGIYRTLDPTEIASRTGLSFDAGTSSFAVTLLGARYRAPYPEFDLVPAEATPEPAPDYSTPAALAPAANGYERLLIIRYLTEGRYALPSGKLLSYEELPWGSVYMQNFRGRVIGRLAREFGGDPEAFSDIVESMPGLNYERLPIGDSSYRVEFINNIFVSLIHYESDDEFPASFQTLFEDNIKYAFTAEDVAVIGDVLIGRLKSHRNIMRKGILP